MAAIPSEGSSAGVVKGQPTQGMLVLPLALIASDRTLWSDALCALLKSQLIGVETAARPLQACALGQLLQRPRFALVAIQRCTRSTCEAIDCLGARRIRILLLAPQDVLPSLAGSVPYARGAISDACSTAELMAAVWAVFRGEYRRPRGWDAWRSACGAALTRRQLELLEHLAHGRSLREAATLLGVTYKTAETFRIQVYRRFGVHNRAELTAYALQQGLMALPEPVHVNGQERINGHSGNSHAAS